MRAMIEWLVISLMSVTVVCSLLFQTLYAQTGDISLHTDSFKVYRILVLYTGRDPMFDRYNASNGLPSPPNSIVKIYAKVLDKYGNNEQAILSYCVLHCFNFRLHYSKLCMAGLVDCYFHPRNVSSWTNTTMGLIDGIPSNGIYRGVIPPQIDKTIINYYVFFKDNLDYSNDISRTHVYEVRGHYIGRLAHVHFVTPESVYIDTNVVDYDHMSQK
ncbi:MAG: hypothetical protein WA364_29720 [Candidatus Nitrosopolaris sp.]